ncbi:hypothetical protein [Pseudoalteromonas fuliginea]|uniref:Uncharacterized protein n=1 Tax=Pseudoalteromonas fuliginea TaxID=1872678 RepID=A0ABQ6RNG5_9GAMM|nr:hypothetical protein [Pseudoalteromonas fuliginea]KAA1166624.1 hypothetical protein EU509_00240 [Pseudoalteromonas fuliginea]KAA1170081.1 hypothetical protein EUZ79_00190 [Pseudoalteromonas fuliginea]
MKLIPLLALFLSSYSAEATEALGWGEIKSLTYRSGWVMFQVVNSQGVNLCKSCPIDPGRQGSEKCWIKEDKQIQLTMLFMSKAQGKKIRGRVVDFSEECRVYEMKVQD